MIKKTTLDIISEYRNKLNSLPHENILDGNIFVTEFYDSMDKSLISEIYKFPFKVIKFFFPEIDFKKKS